MKNIRDLINNEKRVYILLKNKSIAHRFMLDAEACGITFCDDVKPTQRKPDDIMALLPNGTICYVGFLGRMYRNSGQCVCVDYEDVLATRTK